MNRRYNLSTPDELKAYRKRKAHFEACLTHSHEEFFANLYLFFDGASFPFEPGQWQQVLRKVSEFPSKRAKIEAWIFTTAAEVIWGIKAPDAIAAFKALTPEVQAEFDRRIRELIVEAQVDLASSIAALDQVA